MQRRRNPNRTDRVNAEFTKDIYDIITRKLKNPLITEMFSIVKMDTSKDLSSAKVYISVYSGSPERRATTFSAIVSEAKRIRYELAKVSATRTVPELRFVLDDSMEYGDKMDKLFKAIEKGENND
ncbi:MAG: 30S ribosome-binding factor RbfA [Clostridia bacterium]|nr:30S ribosome-binding factor RbfA [Clostridia bacterium]